MHGVPELRALAAPRRRPSAVWPADRTGPCGPVPRQGFARAGVPRAGAWRADGKRFLALDCSSRMLFPDGSGLPRLKLAQEREYVDSVVGRRCGLVPASAVFRSPAAELAQFRVHGGGVRSVSARISAQPGSKSSPSALERIWMWRRASGPARERQIQPLASAKQSRAVWRYARGFRLALLPRDLKQTGAMFEDWASALRKDVSRHRRSGRALRTGEPATWKKPLSVRISQNLGGSSSPQKTCRSAPRRDGHQEAPPPAGGGASRLGICKS